MKLKSEFCRPLQANPGHCCPLGPLFSSSIQLKETWVGQGGAGGGEATLHQGWDPFQVTPTLMGTRLLLECPVARGDHSLPATHLLLGLCQE